MVREQQKERRSVADLCRGEGIDRVFHVAHLGNLPSIVTDGLLSRQELERRGVAGRSLQPEAVQEARRRLVDLPGGVRIALDDLVQMRWVPKTPVLASLAYDWREGRYLVERQRFLVLLEIDVAAFDAAAGLWYATDNPLSSFARFVPSTSFDELPWAAFRAARNEPFRAELDTGKGEILLQGGIAREHLLGCAVCDGEAARHARFVAPDFPVHVEPTWFFAETAVSG